MAKGFMSISATNLSTRVIMVDLSKGQVASRDSSEPEDGAPVSNGTPPTEDGGQPSRRHRLLIFIVAYNAEKTLQPTLQRIPHHLLEEYDVEVLVIDDASKDRTFESGESLRRSGVFPVKLTVLYNPVNQGYGGNQKIGFFYAIEQGFDIVALVHGDGQYAPECLPDLVKPLAEGSADAVFGSRMLTKGAAREGGMPFYKFVGNKILTYTQNRLLKSDLSEFHSGYRLYSVAALKRVPFYLNSNVFHFDTEIIIQFLLAGMTIRELPIPTYYGDEICHVNGVRYAWDVVAASLRAWAQRLGLFYDRKYDCRPSTDSNVHYTAKLGFRSTHSLALTKIPDGARVVDIGCAGGYIAADLKKRGCSVAGIDLFPLAKGVQLDQFYLHDLNAPRLPVDLSNFDYALMLDVLEHLLSPEKFVDEFRRASEVNPNIQLIVSTANIGFVIQRLMLIIGKFNYGKRGVLDLTHTRLFTFFSFKQLFEQAGFDVLEVQGIPAPFPVAVGNNWFSRLMLNLNRFLIGMRKSIFSYQIFLVVRPRPTLHYLLRQAVEKSAIRAAAVEAV
jgi:glycosyltransferase involved in cell wall biosynthesis